jgi:hypothetical protein
MSALSPDGTLRSANATRTQRVVAAVALAILPFCAAGVAMAQASSEEADIAALEAGTPDAPHTSSDRSAHEDQIALALPKREAGAHHAGNLFVAHSWYVAPPAPPPQPEPPAPAPTAPPLPFVYVGSFQQGGATVYFITRGDRTYDVKIGDVIDETYSVDGVETDQLRFTYLPLKEHQTLPLGKPK